MIGLHERSLIFSIQLDGEAFLEVVLHRSTTPDSVGGPLLDQEVDQL